MIHIEVVLADIGFQRPDWHSDAACQEYPQNWWFPTQQNLASTDEARRICRRCLVMTECRQWAMEAGPALDGIWADTNQRQRLALRRKIAVSAAEANAPAA